MNGQDLIIPNQTSVFPNVKEQPTYISFKIIRCLLDNPRMEISGISERISMPSKTVASRLDKTIENHVLDFTLQLNLLLYEDISCLLYQLISKKVPIQRYLKGVMKILRILFVFILLCSVSKMLFTGLILAKMFLLWTQMSKE